MLSYSGLCAAVVVLTFVSFRPLHAGSPPAGRDLAVPLLNPAAEPDPTDQWAVDFETASLWRISDNTFLDYLVLPQALSLRTPAHLRFRFGEDDQLVLRHRFTLLAEAIVEGPESHYFGWSCSPSIEYWTSKHTYFHLSVGGGFGAIDSQGVPGGQGQDFTYNWFITLGVRHYFSRGWAVGAGVMYQHFSNRGATDPNPGLDALGPMLGISRSF